MRTSAARKMMPAAIITAPFIFTVMRQLFEGCFKGSTVNSVNLLVIIL